MAAGAWTGVRMEGKLDSVHILKADRDDFFRNPLVVLQVLLIGHVMNSSYFI